MHRMEIQDMAATWGRAKILYRYYRSIGGREQIAEAIARKRMQTAHWQSVLRRENKRMRKAVKKRGYKLAPRLTAKRSKKD